jgi:hypothetical protein
MKEKKLLNKERRREKNRECVEEREDTEDYTRRTKNWRIKWRQGAYRRSENGKRTETRMKRNGKGKETKGERINFKNRINNS